MQVETFGLSTTNFISKNWNPDNTEVHPFKSGFSINLDRSQHLFYSIYNGNQDSNENKVSLEEDDIPF